MQDKKLKLDTQKMLGFRLLSGQKAEAQLGAKVGDKGGVAPNQLGAKVGGKMPPPRITLGAKVGTKAGVKGA